MISLKPNGVKMWVTMTRGRRNNEKYGQGGGQERRKSGCGVRVERRRSFTARCEARPMLRRLSSILLRLVHLNFRSIMFAKCMYSFVESTKQLGHCPLMRTNSSARW